MIEDTDRKIFDELIETTSELIENRVEIIRLTAIEKFSKLAGIIAIISIIALTSLLALIFLSFMAAHLFSEMFGSLFLGFGLVGLIYILLVLILYTYRNPLIKKPVTNFSIKILNESDGNF